MHCALIGYLYVLQQERGEHAADDLFYPLDQAEIEFENEGGETFVCGNPPSWRNQNKEQKADLKSLLGTSKNLSAH